MKPLDLENAETIYYLDAEKLIRDSNGSFFRVEFIKRSNGAYRRMVGRIGVRPLNPRPRRPGAFDPASAGLIRVWESTNGYRHTGKSRDDAYRMVGVERIKALRIRGRTYKVIGP